MRRLGRSVEAIAQRVSRCCWHLTGARRAGRQTSFSRRSADGAEAVWTRAKGGFTLGEGGGASGLRRVAPAPGTTWPARTVGGQQRVKTGLRRLRAPQKVRRSSCSLPGCSSSAAARRGVPRPSLPPPPCGCTAGTKWPGLRAAGVAMAFELIQSARTGGKR